MGVSSDEECFENKAVGADMEMDHGIGTCVPVVSANGEQDRKLDNYLSDGIRETEASTADNNIDNSKLKSPLFRTILSLAAKYGNEECLSEICQIVSSENEMQDHHQEVVADRVLAQHAGHHGGHYWEELLENENYWKDGDTALHWAAKRGQLSILKRLISDHFQNSENLKETLDKILERNKKGNNFFHEALIHGHHGVMDILVSHIDGNFNQVAKEAVSMTNAENKSGVYLAIEAGYKHVVDQALTHVIPNDPKYVPQGKSLLLAAIIKQDCDILELVLTRKPQWIHLRDSQGRIPLHYAASLGYLGGVQSLLAKCDSCALERDINGYIPIHLAAYGDHVTVVQELLKSKYCPDLRGIRDSGGRNILHLAVLSGKLNVVKYILQASMYGENMINEQDYEGNTPLHLASSYCHPKIVHTLTWDKRVDLTLLNRKGQTALDAIVPSDYISLKKLLTWTTLTSAGARHAEPKSSTIKVPPSHHTDISLQQEKPIQNPYKDTIGTLLLVSTLIITVTFASGFTMPGGTNSSGEAVMLHQIWFKLFIFSITISMYGAITATLILIWAQLGDVYLAFFSVEAVNSLLAVTLTTLSLAFLAAVHLVVKDLSWLATASLVLSFLSIFSMVLLFMLVFWFPSASRIRLVRYLSYYPFLMMASLIQYYESRPY